MKITKKLESTFTDNIIYILESTHKNLLINKNGDSVSMLGKDINTIEYIKLKDSVYISSMLHNNEGNKVLLYCPDDTLLIYGDMISKRTFSIKINELKERYLTPLYEWDTNNVLLSTHDKYFYQLDCTTEQLEEISTEKVIQNNPQFYSFWQIVQKHGFGYQINSQQKTFIYKDEDRKEIVYFDFINNIKTVTQDPQTKYHDIVYLNGFFIFVAEENLTIVKGNDIYHYSTEKPSYSFLRARLMIEGNKTFMITLTTNDSGSIINKITKYELE